MKEVLLSVHALGPANTMGHAGESGSGTITLLFLDTATPGAPGEILRKLTISR